MIRKLHFWKSAPDAHELFILLGRLFLHKLRLQRRRSLKGLNKQVKKNALASSYHSHLQHAAPPPLNHQMHTMHTDSVSSRKWSQAPLQMVPCGWVILLHRLYGKLIQSRLYSVVKCSLVASNWYYYYCNGINQNMYKSISLIRLLE